MRLSEVRDFLALRRIVRNPWEVLRFRKKGEGASIQIRLLGKPPLHIRGGRSDFHMFHRIYLADEYRLGSLGLPELNTVVDIGANVGLFAARIAPQAGRVVAYEPMPVNFAELEKNTAGLDNVVAVRAAVAGQSGQLRFYSPLAAKRSGIFSAYPETGSHDMSQHVDVPAMTLDALFEQHEIERCDLLKLDVEGAEYEILHAASETSWARICRIYGEYHDVRPEDERTRLESFRAFLESKDFRVEVLPHRRKRNHGMFFAVRKTIDHRE